MVQGVNKEYIFYKKEYIEKYLDIMQESKRNYNFEILSYCIMNNHAHFLVYVEDINELGDYMKRVNQSYVKMYNRLENRCGVLFRNRFKTEPIYDIKYLINCIKYIHNNPVKAKIVTKPEDYPYSSYKDYLNNKGATQCKIMKKIFGEDCNYLELFNNAFEKRFMDAEKESEEEFSTYVLEGIREFKKENNQEIVEVFSNRELFKKLIEFLNQVCGFSYVELKRYFNISTSTMEGLKIR